MKYRNYKIGFTFEVPDDFSEVKESTYEVFNVDPDTLHYFILLDDDGNIMRSLSLVKDDTKVKDDKKLKELIDSNVKAMEDAEMKVLVNNELTTDSGKTIYRYVFYDKYMEQNLGILMYFMRVKDALIVSSTYIVEFYDNFEDELFSIFNSIEEL